MAALNRSILNLHCIERGARLLMGGIAFGAAIVSLTFKAGWVSASASYDRQSWYLVTEYDGYMITDQVDDEVACRKLEHLSSACYSGASMMARQSTAMK